MIIIKSQDGTIAEYRKVLPSELLSKEYGVIALHSGNVHETVGIYQTEERTKEVMDEIEEHMQDKYASEQFAIMFTAQAPKIESLSDLMGENGNIVTRYIEKAQEKLIYTMPEE